MLYNKWWKNTGDVCTRQVNEINFPVIFLKSIVMHLSKNQKV